jgi:N-acetylmuramoyl-L-alanine amidase
MVTDPKYRMWVYRIAAPAAFFLAATILVVLIERGLNGDSQTPTTVLPTTSAPDTTTTAGTTTSKKKIYRVKAGDTLESIAAKFDTTVDDLLALNPNVDPLALSPGQKIRVA